MPVSPTQPRASRVLVVDDDAALGRMLELELREAGFLVDAAASCAAAAELLRSGGYDYLILDYQLPDGDGLGLLRALRRQQIPTPVLLMSGGRDAALVSEAMRLGAEGFLEKPISGAAVERLIRASLEGHANRPAFAL
jgi:DNA-binding response OmpR family regulator